MATQPEVLKGSTAISSPADKFYNFFKYDMNDLVIIIPDSFHSVELLQGQDGAVGAVKLWKYSLAVGGVSLSVTMETIGIDDAKKSITFKVIDGDVLLLYKTYQFTVEVSDGLVVWTIEYEKALLTSPPPDAYIAFALMTSKLVDDYLLTH